MRSSLSVPVRFAAAAALLLAAGVASAVPGGPIAGQIEWDNKNPTPFSLASVCNPISYTITQPDGGAWDGGQVMVDLLTGANGIEVRDGQCNFAIGQQAAGADGKGTFNVVRLLADAGSVFDTVAISAMDFVSPYPYPVQYGGPAPSQLRTNQAQWSAPVNACNTGVVTYTDSSGNPWFPVGAQQVVSILVSPDNTELKLYSDEFCTVELQPGTFNQQRYWLIPPWGPNAFFSYRGTSVGQYSGNATTQLFSGAAGVSFNIGGAASTFAYATYGSAAQTVVAGLCSAPVVVQVHQANGAAALSDGTYRVQVSGPSHFEFFADDLCTNVMPKDGTGKSSLGIDAGFSTASYRFISTVAGSHLTSLSPGNAPLSLHTETISPAPLASLAVPDVIAFREPGQTLPAFAVRGFDVYGNDAFHTGNITLTLLGGVTGNGLLGTTVRPYDNGTHSAVFDDIAVKLAGEDLQLQASASTSAGVLTGESSPFRILEAQAPELKASVAPLDVQTCGSTLVTLWHERDGGEVDFPETVEVCADSASLARVASSTLTGGDGGLDRCAKGSFSDRAEIKFKAVVPTVADITVVGSRATQTLSQVTWRAGPPVARRSTLEVGDGQSVLLAPGGSSTVTLTVRDACSGLADMTGQVVTFESGSALSVGTVGVASSVASAKVTLNTCDGVPQEGVALRALINGVPVDDGSGGVQQVFVRGDCTLKTPLAAVTLSTDRSEGAFRTHVKVTAELTRLDPSAASVRLRLLGTGLELAGGGSRDVDVDLSASPVRLELDAVLTGDSGGSASIVATPIDGLGRIAGESARRDVAITRLPTADLGCSASGGGAVALLMLAAALRRRVRPVA